MAHKRTDKLSTGTSGNSEIPYYDHLALVSGNANYNDEAVYILHKVGTKS